MSGSGNPNVAALGDLERVEVRSRAEWRVWLTAHHGQSVSIWLVTWKKGRGPYLPYGEVVEEALAFGWVDSRPAKLDEDRTMLLLSPRKPGSRWSAANQLRIASMTAWGLMAPAGNAAVARARADGTWSALDDVEALIVPADLAQALEKAGDAAANFAGFPPSARRGILEWILSAKAPTTRALRIADTAERAARNERANQWVRKP